jgi:multidrug efflux pump subunit AcrB
VGALGLTQSDVDSTLTAAWAGNYVNDFIDRGRVKRVYVQGDAPFRSRPEDLGDWYVRTATGAMAPFSAFASTSWGQSPATVSRFNGLSSFEIEGAAAPGRSTGEAMERMQALTDAIAGTSIAWAGLSYQEQLSSGQAPFLYAISLVVVFLCLAALYESWTIPLAVILVVPLGIVGALLGAKLTGLDNNIYLQVGLITTMGLASKNAILIVEFAEERMRAGASCVESAVEGARLRLRPIIMTSFAFVFGVLPLAIATGPGAGAQTAIGRAVVGGTLTATFLAIFFVPLFFVFVKKCFRQDKPAASPDLQPVPAE